MKNERIRMPGTVHNLHSSQNSQQTSTRPAYSPNRPFSVVKGYKNRLTLHKSIIIVSVLILLMLSGQRMIKIFEQNRLINQLQLQMESERIRNQQLISEIEILQSPEGIERIAREQLGLVKKNEIVIRPITIEPKDK